MTYCSRCLACLVTLMSFALATAAKAQVGDPTLRTDHPHYPGEGAFQTVADCVEFATRGRKTPHEKALAMYYWLLTHQWHLLSPQEWNTPGKTPTAGHDDDMTVYDANRARFSYGWGLCGTVHAWNEPYWRALGMPARRRHAAGIAGGGFPCTCGSRSRAAPSCSPA